MNLSFIKSFKIFLSILSLLILLLNESNVIGEVCGKFDCGPAFLHIDVLTSGKTVKKIDMPAIKADSTIAVWQGLCLKPSLLFGKQNRSQLLSTSLGIGYYIPVHANWTLIPSFGALYTELETSIRLPVTYLRRERFKEKFHSIAPYCALEVAYCFLPGWRVSGLMQYAWSRTQTTITRLGRTKSSSQGPNYGVLLEHDLNDRWSINLGGAYNSSLTKEKHGLRGYGFKLGLALWF